MNGGLGRKGRTLWDAVPGELFEFLQVYNAGVKEGLEMLLALGGAVVLQVLVTLRFLHLLFPIEDNNAF